MISRKVMLLGEIGVGKSSLARRLVDDVFEATYIPTIGVDVHRYTLPKPVDGELIRLIIWDTDGNFGDTIFSHVYMREAAAAMIVGDVTRRTTMESMVRLSEGFATAMPGRPMAFVVNKIDLLGPGEEPLLPPALSRSDIAITMTSAQSGAHVQEAFHTMAAAIRRRGQ